MRGHKDPVTICITSGKGGVGKTSIAINLAFALIERKQKVLLVDGDLGLANVDVMMGISAKKTIKDVLDTGADPIESVVYPEQGLGVLPAGSGTPEMVTLGPDEQKTVEGFLRSLGSNFNYVLIDTSAGIGPSVLWLNNFVDYNIIILTPDPTSMTDAYALIKVLSRDYGKNQFYLVLNLIRNNKEGLLTYNTLEKTAEKFLSADLEYLGEIPEDDVVRKSVRQQSPFIKLAPKSNAVKAVRHLAERVLSLKPV